MTQNRFSFKVYRRNQHFGHIHWGLLDSRTVGQYIFVESCLVCVVVLKQTSEAVCTITFQYCSLPTNPPYPPSLIIVASCKLLSRMCHCQSEKETQPWEVSHEFGKEILRLESGDHLYHWMLGEIFGEVMGHRFSLRHAMGDSKDREATTATWITCAQPHWGLCWGSLLYLQGASWLRLCGVKL